MRSRSWTFAVVLLVPCFALAQGFDAKKTFQMKCSMCHGSSGTNPTTIGKNLAAPDLSSDKVQKMSDRELHDTIEHGKGKMPAYGNAIGVQNVDAMVKYVKSLKR